MDDAKCLSQSFQYFDHKLDDSTLQVLDLKIFFRLQALRLHTQHIAFVAFESFHPWCKTSGFQTFGVSMACLENCGQEPSGPVVGISMNFTSEGIVMLNTWPGMP